MRLFLTLHEVRTLFQIISFRGWMILQNALRIVRLPRQTYLVSCGMPSSMSLHPLFITNAWGKEAHPMNIGDCLAWARRRHPILARPNDKSGMTLKPCTSAQFQRDLKIRNILDTTKNSSASCAFIIRLLKRFGEPGCRSTGVVNCHYFQ